MKDLLLAIDQGTTGSTAVLLDAQGRTLGRATREFPQHFPRPGWVEHDVEEIWQSVLGAIGEALGRAEVDAGRIAAIGITNQRETTVLWDRERGEAVHRAIVWQDRRTADRCRRLEEAGHGPLVRERTGLVLDPYFSGTKLAWLLEHVEGARARAEAGELAFGTIDSWLLWRLSGGAVHVTDASNASRTLLFDIHRGCWDETLCELLEVPLAVLPQVRGCSKRYAVTRGVPVLPDGVPISGMAGDQQAALFGQACFEPGEAKCTYGTGAFLLVQTGERAVASGHGLLTTVAWRIGERTCYALEGSAFVAGAAVQWLRDGLGLIERAADVESLAARVPDTGGVVFVPALAGLGAPHWDPDARGAVLGLTRGTTSAHLARAVLEGIAFQVVELAEAMAADAGGPLRRMRVDGGASANTLLMQMQSDLLGLPVERPQNVESTALGAAYLAGLAEGVFPDLAAIAAVHRIERRFEPEWSASRRMARRRQWAEAVRRAAGWAPFAELGGSR